MKRTCLVLAIGVFLTLMMISPSNAAEKVKFSIKTGGSLASISQGYDFSLSFDARDETGRLSETVPNVGSKFGFDIGLGIFPIPQLEVYASYSSCGGAALSDYSLTIPHFWYYDTSLNSKATVGKDAGNPIHTKLRMCTKKMGTPFFLSPDSFHLISMCISLCMII